VTGKNVLVPIPLVKRIIALLECVDVSEYDRAIRDDCADILQSLIVKMRSLELRDAYAEIIAADDDDSRNAARASYHWQKDRLNDFSGDG